MEHVAPGSVIITDSWASYEGLDTLEGYNYKVIDNCQAPGNYACLLAYPRTPLDSLNTAEILL